MKKKKIKSRTKAKTRFNLFTKVADWSISPIKRSRDMLKIYGYDRSDGRKLNCTVRSKAYNSQHLKLVVDEKNEFLIEVHETIGPLMYWPFRELIDAFRIKHYETFWIEAESRIDSEGCEEFLYTKIIHTKAPVISELIPLLEKGFISLDHQISKNKERGPAFKLDSTAFDDIFMDPKKINLQDIK